MRRCFRSSVVGLALVLGVLPLSGHAAPSPRLRGADLLPSPTFDAGNGVPGRSGWALGVGRAETFRNIAEILPTRRIAASATPFPLRQTDRSFGVRYAFQGATYTLDTFQSFSAGKSFVSTLVGFALADGKIKSLEDSIAIYLPEVKGSAYEHAKIRDVLQMASGTSYTEEYEDPDSDIAEFARIADRSEGGLYDFARSFKAKRPPGTQFYYASTDTEMLGALVHRVTGQSLSAYMSEKLWKPIGAEATARWALDASGAKGREIAAGALQITLRDYARFGYLFAHDGMMGAKRVLPAGWVAEATVPRAPYLEYGKLEPNDPTGYGYQWWCIPDEHRSFTAEGIHGQYVMVDPIQHVVVVKLSAWPEAWDDVKAAETVAFFEAVTGTLR